MRGKGRRGKGGRKAAWVGGTALQRASINGGDISPQDLGANSWVHRDKGDEGGGVSASHFSEVGSLGGQYM